MNNQEKNINILEINYCDLVGRIFNGYELQNSLNARGNYTVNQIVKDKLSSNPHVHAIGSDYILQEEMKHIEKSFSISNLLSVCGLKLYEMEVYKRADLLHYHILHNDFISLLDLPLLMKHKKSVWTIHDPWIVTGNCVHPLSCERWKTGCGNCSHLDYKWFEMREDNTSEMWKLKKEILGKVNPTIVVASAFMQNYIENSPLTDHFTDIVKIPFGVKTKSYQTGNKNEMKKKFSLTEEDFVIGFRSEESKIKGCDFLYTALKHMEKKEHISLLVIGSGKIPDYLKEMYRVVELGWVNDETIMEQFFASCDVFAMPSLAESFGLMAIEAMAAGVPVLCFQGTVLEELIHAPECGIAVKYKSVKELKQSLEYLNENRHAREQKGNAGRNRVQKHYTYEQYIDRHVQLYERLYEEK